MITHLSVENYKSIQKLEMSLGRTTVLIGANGSGKSNILEALALGSAAANNKLDNEFLAARGIRVTSDPRLMRAAFEKKDTARDITIRFQQKAIGRKTTRKTTPGFEFLLHNQNNQPYSSWSNQNDLQKSLAALRDSKLEGEKRERKINDLLARMEAPEELRRFLIYSPEYRMLRTFEEEGQIQPLGVAGEGLWKLLGVLRGDDPDAFADIKSRLEIIDWFEDFAIPSGPAVGERNLRLKDRFLAPELEDFSQRSANEGFLFLLFYFCLFLSKDTPAFFAIDNIDSSLNPKMCSHLIAELDNIASEKGKQVVLTTHNPAVLDGLNLNDEEQRLFVISRNGEGHTRAERVAAPQAIEGQTPVRLSEAFLRGYIGGLPRNF